MVVIRKEFRHGRGLFGMKKCEVNRSKWAKCNNFELLWWERWKNRIDLDPVRKELIERANNIRKIIDRFFPSDHRRILQIGPGANAEIHFLSGERYAIDPLATYFKENFSNLIDPKVNFIEGIGEKLPYPDSFFDAILILNVLDHCWDPTGVLREISRCLHKDGLLVLPVNIYSRTASVLHWVFNFLDKEHPHALTYKFLRSHLVHEFDLIEESFLSLKLPEHDKRKKAILSILKAVHLVPVRYKAVFKRK